MKRLTGILAIALGAAWVTGAADEAGLVRLDAARTLWQGAQDGDYRYSYRKYCECYPQEPPITVVSVSDWAVDRVYHLRGEAEREVPAREGSFSFYWTMDELFDKLEAAYAAEVTVRAEYHPELGYPLTLYIDYDRGFSGDETDLRLTGVELP